MHKEMTDQELKESMKTITKIAGVKLSDERIERDLSAYKTFLSNVDLIKTVEVTVEDEPMPLFQLKKKGQK